MKYYLTVFVLTTGLACSYSPSKPTGIIKHTDTIQALESQLPAYDTAITAIHVFVALCDNKYQGIVPVPAGIGNGQDANSNLYWGCGYGVKTFFTNSAQWKLVRRYKLNDTLLERIIFKSKNHNTYLVADAYNGRYIQQCTANFLKGCAGINKDTIGIENHTIGICGNAKLLAYVGHDGLMDFELKSTYTNQDGIARKAIILACASRNYFWKHLQATKAQPILWTTNLMCPEAYTLHDAIESFLDGSTDEIIRNAAANAYAKYQKCSIKAAKGLLVTGW